MPNNQINIIVGLIDKTKAGASGVMGGLKQIAASAGDTLAKFGLISLGINAVTGVIGSLTTKVKEYVDAANIQERAETKLATILKTLTNGTQEQADALIKQAGAMQNLTGYGDEAVISAQAMLGTFALTSEQIATLTPRLLDMAEGQRRLGNTSLDLESLSTALGKAFTGNISGLAKMGVTMTDAQKEMFNLGTQQEKVAILSEILDQNYKGLAETVGKTFEGSVRKLEDAQGDLNEVIGFSVTKNKDVQNSVDAVTQGYVDAQNLILENKDAIAAAMSAGVGSIVILIDGVKLAFNTAQILFQGAALVITETLSIISSAIAAVTFGEVSKKWQQNADDMSNISEALAEGLKNDFKEGVKAVNGIISPLESIKTQSADTMESVTKTAEETARQYQKATAVIEKSFEQTKQALEFDTQVSKERLDKNLALITENLAAELAAIDDSNAIELEKSAKKNSAILAANKATLDAKLAQQLNQIPAIDSAYQAEIAKFANVKQKQSDLEFELASKKKAIYAEVEKAYADSISKLIELDKQHRDKALSFQREIEATQQRQTAKLRELDNVGLSDAAQLENKKKALAQDTALYKQLIAQGEFEKAAELSKQNEDLAYQIAAAEKQAALAGSASATEAQTARNAYLKTIEQTKAALTASKQSELSQADAAKTAAAEQSKNLAEIRTEIDGLNAKIVGIRTIDLSVDKTELDAAIKAIADIPAEKTILIKTVEGHQAGGMIGILKRASGGGIPDFSQRARGKLPGFGGGDKIPLLAEAGEYMVNKFKVRKEGNAALNALNADKATIVDNNLLAYLTKKMALRRADGGAIAHDYLNAKLSTVSLPKLPALSDQAAIKSLGAYELNLSMGNIILPAKVAPQNQDVLKTLLKQLEQQKRLQR